MISSLSPPTPTKPPAEGAGVETYPFHPWVRSTCRKALVWGLTILALLVVLAFHFQAPGAAPMSRAFAVLALYAVLFLASLAKIWWTAREPAVVVTGDALSYRLLHTFRPRVIRFADVLWCGPRAGTESLRLVHLTPGDIGREFFLNLAVVKRRHHLVDRIGEELERHGLSPVPNRRDTWARPGWEDGAEAP